MAATLASPPGECCIKGFRHTGTPIGSTVTLGGLQTYVSNSPEGSNDKIILFFPDVYGPFYINNQLLIDYFASNGYLVLAPDYFEGSPIHTVKDEPGFDFQAWLDSSLARARKTTPTWIDAAVREYGNEKTKYGTVGYCFGAPFVLDICATDRVRAGAVAHPAFLDEDHFRKVKQPIFLSCCEVDATFPTKSRHTSEDILIEIKATYHYQLFSGVEHGFALRGNMEIENERWAKEESAKSIVGWWHRFLLEGKSNNKL